MPATPPMAAPTPKSSRFDIWFGFFMCPLSCARLRLLKPLGDRRRCRARESRDENDREEADHDPCRDGRVPDHVRVLPGVGVEVLRLHLGSHDVPCGELLVCANNARMIAQSVRPAPAPTTIVPIWLEPALGLGREGVIRVRSVQGLDRSGRLVRQDLENQGCWDRRPVCRLLPPRVRQDPQRSRSRRCPGCS
jgi:hypothetical protein